MKRWAIVLISVTLCMVLGNNLYATEDINIYQEPQIQNKGRIVINCYATGVTDSAPIENVKIEVYYRYNKVMHNIKELNIFKYTNLALTSDENGKIILTNLPYGLYQYKVVSVPPGHEFSQELKTLDLNLMNETINEELNIIRQVIVIDEEIEEKVENKKEEVKPQEEIKVEENKKEEVSSQIIPEVNIPSNNDRIIIEGQITEGVLDKELNNLANNLFITNEQPKTSIMEKIEATEDKKIMQQVSKELIRKATEKEVDTIQEMKTVRITEKIKIAVVTMDDAMCYLKDMSNSQRSDIDKALYKRKNILDKPQEKKLKNTRISITIRMYNSTGVRGR